MSRPRPLWLALALAQLVASCASAADDGSCQPARELLSETLVADTPSAPFEVDGGELIASTSRTSSGGVILDAIGSEPLFIIGADAEPDITRDPVNGLKSTNDTRFRNGKVSVEPGSYRVYTSSSGLNVTVSSCEPS